MCSTCSACDSTRRATAPCALTRGTPLRNAERDRGLGRFAGRAARSVVLPLLVLRAVVPRRGCGTQQPLKGTGGRRTEPRCATTAANSCVPPSCGRTLPVEFQFVGLITRLCPGPRKHRVSTRGRLLRHRSAGISPPGPVTGTGPPRSMKDVIGAVVTFSDHMTRGARPDGGTETEDHA